MYTVLVVEDDPGVRRVVRWMLAKGGYNVLDTGPDQAAEIAATHPEPIDLLITDVSMPPHSCKRVVAGVLRHRPGLKVLYMSGYNEDITERCGVSRAAVNFLRKPFTPENLTRKVRDVLERTSAAEVAETALKTVAAVGPA